ncbi:hypothetical protein KKG72_02675 [bacterium]|nr:hypothetical protein [bacterium]MBU1994263.1 hypothetical protein [bacterium]
MNKLFLLIMPLFLFAQMLQIGDDIIPITLKSQHDKKQTLTENGIWIIAWDKESTKVANKFFDTKIMPKNINLLIDISQVPSGIFNLFVLPNMKIFKHQILLSFDEKYNITLPYKEGSLTILHIEDKTITQIQFAQNQAQLKEALK